MISTCRLNSGKQSCKASLAQVNHHLSQRKIGTPTMNLKIKPFPTGILLYLGTGVK